MLGKGGAHLLHLLRDAAISQDKAMRKATIERSTTETSITASVDLDGSGAYEVATGIGFLDHMLEQLARHSLIDVSVAAKGDLHIDHLSEALTFARVRVTTVGEDVIFDGQFQPAPR